MLIVALVLALGLGALLVLGVLFDDERREGLRRAGSDENGKARSR